MTKPKDLLSLLLLLAIGCGSSAPKFTEADDAPAASTEEAILFAPLLLALVPVVAKGAEICIEGGCAVAAQGVSRGGYMVVAGAAAVALAAEVVIANYRLQLLDVPGDVLPD